MSERYEGYHFVDRCPMALMDEELSRAYQARVAHESHDMLPSPGGWGDQPATWVSFNDHLDAEIAKIRAEAAEKMAAEAKRRKR